MLEKDEVEGIVAAVAPAESSKRISECTTEERDEGAFQWVARNTHYMGLSRELIDAVERALRHAGRVVTSLRASLAAAERERDEVKERHAVLRAKYDKRAAERSSILTAQFAASSRLAAAEARLREVRDWIPELRGKVDLSMGVMGRIDAFLRATPAAAEPGGDDHQTCPEVRRILTALTYEGPRVIERVTRRANEARAAERARKPADNKEPA